MSNKSDEKQGGTKEIGDDAASMHQEDGTSAASDDATMTPDGVHDDDDAGNAVTVKDDDATDEQTTQTPEERQEEQTATTEETEKDDDATPTADETDADADADGNDDTNDTPSTDDEDESDTDASPSNADDASPDANDTVTDTSDTASDEDDAERQDDETAATQDVPPTEGDDANRHDDEDSDGKQDATEDVSDADGSADDGDKTGNADTKANDASADAETGNADAESEAADVAAKSDADTETSDANVNAEKGDVVTDDDGSIREDDAEQHGDATAETLATSPKVDDDTDESVKDRDGAKRRHVGRKKVTAIACGIAIAAIAAGCLYVGHETSSALTQASSAIAQAKDTDSSMRGVLERTKSFANLTDDDVMPDDGGKDGILPAYATARKAASDVVTKKMPNVDGIAWYDLNGSRAVRDDAKEMAGKKRDALRTLRSSVNKVTTSKHKRECTDAKNALKASSGNAQKVLDSTEGKVHDNAIRQTLADAIDGGNKLLGEKDLLSASVYSSAQGKIDAASKAVSDDHAKWQKEKEAAEAAERARKAAAARKTYASRSAAAAAASSSGGQPVQSSDGTWYVAYRGNDVEGTANADGSVSEYCDGYFVAHRGTKNGNMIASKPRRVVVDGKSYHYVSSTIVDDDTDLDYALSYLRQNGGIGFQTCTIPSGRDILVHYEPDN